MSTDTQATAHDHDHDHDHGDGHSHDMPVHRLNLSVDVKDAGPCLKHIRVTIPRVDIETLLCRCHRQPRRLRGSAWLSRRTGFRRRWCRSGSARKLQDQVKQKLLIDSLEQVAEDNKLDPINEPNLDVAALDLPQEGDFEYEFDVEVRPSFELPDYGGLKIERPTVNVTDEQVNTYLERFLAQYGQLTPHEGAAEAGDYLTLKVIFTRNGERLNELDEVNARLRPVLRFRDAELENFQELFAGKHVGETCESDLKISSEAQSVELRGETVHAKFEILDIKRLELPEMNKALLDRIGAESEEDVRKNVQDTLKRQAEYRQRQFARTQVLSKITESAKLGSAREAGDPPGRQRTAPRTARNAAGRFHGNRHSCPRKSDSPECDHDHSPGPERAFRARQGG